VSKFEESFAFQAMAEGDLALGGVGDVAIGHDLDVAELAVGRELEGEAIK
jgi:hypothetical protein